MLIDLVIKFKELVTKPLNDMTDIVVDIITHELNIEPLMTSVE